MLQALARLGRAGSMDLRAAYQVLSARSIRAAAAEQELETLIGRLREAVPDVSRQYTEPLDPQEFERYWEIKLRALHAFQIRCLLDALTEIPRQQVVIADIGDSSGNHATYIRHVAPAGKVGRVISVNLDPVAVEKVKQAGGDAILCRAEEMDLEGVRPDLFVTFEMLEHLTDPIGFLHRLATHGSADRILVTVPYRKASRFGGFDLRRPIGQVPDRLTPEAVHIFELSPQDWSLLARFAGYRTVFTRIYLQYPKVGLTRLLQPLWRKLDYEGFLGLLLERDLTVANRYTGW